MSKRTMGKSYDESSGSGPILKTGGGFGHSTIPREGYYPKATQHGGDTRRDSYRGGWKTKHSVDRKVAKKKVV